MDNCQILAQIDNKIVENIEKFLNYIVYQKNGNLYYFGNDDNNYDNCGNTLYCHNVYSKNTTIIGTYKFAYLHYYNENYTLLEVDNDGMYLLDSEKHKTTKIFSTSITKKYKVLVKDEIIYIYSCVKDKCTIKKYEMHCKDTLMFKLSNRITIQTGENSKSCASPMFRIIGEHIVVSLVNRYIIILDKDLIILAYINNNLASCLNKEFDHTVSRFTNKKYFEFISSHYSKDEISRLKKCGCRRRGCSELINYDNCESMNIFIIPKMLDMLILNNDEIFCKSDKYYNKVITVNESGKEFEISYYGDNKDCLSYRVYACDYEYDKTVSIKFVDFNCVNNQNNNEIFYIKKNKDDGRYYLETITFE